jgi:hypothetical protein
MGIGADLCRWATFAVWEDEGALEGHLVGAPAPGTESFSVRLAYSGSRGSWRGVDPFAGATPTALGPGPVAVLTRATVAIGRWWAFHRAVAPVEASLDTEAGLLAAVGVGEAPVGRLATFSLWRSMADAESFAYGAGSPHAAVIGRARAEGWFTEELFVRFRPYRSTGTWDGVDPLATARDRAGGRGS